MNYSYERVSTIRQDVRRQELSLLGYKIDKKNILIKQPVKMQIDLN